MGKYGVIPDPEIWAQENRNRRVAKVLRELLENKDMGWGVVRDKLSVLDRLESELHRQYGYSGS